MKITKDAVAYLDYVLKDSQGETLDASEPGEPLAYIHGYGNLVEGLEKKLAGCSIGDSLTVAVPPEEGYGEYNDDLIYTFPRSDLDGIENLSVGMILEVETDDGDATLLRVVKIEAEEVTLDGNHPFAGQTVEFQVKVLDVRAATPEEIEHEHVHGPEGHTH